MVHLLPGHSVEAHSRAINRDLESHILSKPYKLIWRNGMVYIGYGIDEEFLKDIRADPGVEFVACDGKVW